MLMNGPISLAQAKDRLGGADGSVSQESGRIQILDELDAIEVSEERDQDFAGRLKLTELRKKDEWKQSTHEFLVGQLRFGDWARAARTIRFGRTGFNDPRRGTKP